MNHHRNHITQVIDLGITDYQSAWDFQTNLFNKILAVKTANRYLPESDQQITDNYLIFCEHPHVFTLGKSGDSSNLLISPVELNNIGASYYHINRGGDITYHGPGQIVVYPVIDLENFFTDIHQYMRLLEEAVIQTLQGFNIAASRIAGLTGVWLGVEQASTARKICALGVKTSRWVTMHGLAFNVNTNLDYFRYIVPCGIADKAVTSMQHELGQPQPITIIKEKLKQNLASLFHMQLTPAIETIV